MSTRRPSRHAAPPQPLLSHSTLTFIGHWRGQLLITIIVLFVGFIYFIVREPIERWRRRRRERLSARARGALLALEAKRVEREDREKEREEASAASGTGGSIGGGSGSGDRGRERRKDGKKRKASLLRINPGGEAAALPSASVSGSSSIEGSPAPGSSTARKSSMASGAANLTAGASSQAETSTLSSVPPDTPASRVKSKSKTGSTPNQTTPESSPATPEIRLRAPADESSNSKQDRVSETTNGFDEPQSTIAKLAVVTSEAPSQSPAHTNRWLDPEREPDVEAEAWMIPLPASPYAGPSRLYAPASISDSHSTDGRSEADSSDTRIDDEADIKLNGNGSGHASGFSIYPEDGYLPPSALAPAAAVSGKKKRRGKKGGGGAGAGSTEASSSSSRGPAQAIGIPTAQLGSPGPTTIPNSPSRTNRLRSTSIPLSLALISESSPLASPVHGLPSPRDRTGTSNGLFSPSTFPPSSPHPASPSGSRPTHSRSHSRKTSLGGRPANMDLEDLLVERERTIDALRAEIGLAKAEEAKSKEDAERARRGEEAVKDEVDRVRRAGGKVETEMRRREGELHRRLAQANDLISAQGARLGMIEQLLASAGLSLPPPISPMPPFSHTNSSQRLHSMPTSPMPMPASPYPLGYPNGIGSTRGMVSPMVPYPSPGVFAGQGGGGTLHPHPHFAQQYSSHGQMSTSSSASGSSQAGLHPHPHQHQHQHQPLSPGPFRRTSSHSASAEPDPLAGPLTPGLMGYPVELGMGRPMTMTLQGHPNSGGEHLDEGASMSDGVGMGIGGEMDEERRASIAVSVMKKKQNAEMGNGDASKGVDLANPASSQAIPTAAVAGLGVDGVDAVPSRFTGIDVAAGIASGGLITTSVNEGHGDSIAVEGENEAEADPGVEYDHSSSSSSHRTSPSPKRILVTPGAPDIINGTTGLHTALSSEPLIIIRNGNGNGRGSRSSSGSGRGRLQLVEDDSTSSGMKLHYTNTTTSASAPEPMRKTPHPDLTAAAGDEQEQVADTETHQHPLHQEQPDYAPTFASLAHTPEQLQEIARMREVALRRYSLERRASGMSANGGGQGQGQGGR